MVMSALTPKADIDHWSRNVRFVPIANIVCTFPGLLWATTGQAHLPKSQT